MANTKENIVAFGISVTRSDIHWLTAILDYDLTHQPTQTNGFSRDMRAGEIAEALSLARVRILRHKHCSDVVCCLSWPAVSYLLTLLTHVEGVLLREGIKCSTMRTTLVDVGIQLQRIIRAPNSLFYMARSLQADKDGRYHWGERVTRTHVAENVPPVPLAKAADDTWMGGDE